MARSTGGELTSMARSRFATALFAGLVSGFLVLGIGGRIAMRLIAYTSTAPLELTLGGILVVLGAGAAWGALTAPLLLLLERLRPRIGWCVGLVFGASVLLLAVVAFVVVQGTEGIVAPPAFILLSAVLFPALFLGHGLVVQALMVHWRPPGTSS